MKNSLEWLILLSIMIICAGCQRNISGFYCNNPEKLELITSKLELHLYPDSTYSFSLQGDLYSACDSGIWKLNKNKISLCSTLKDDIVVYSSSKVNGPDVAFFVFMQDSTPLVGAFVELNDSTRKMIDDKGKVTMPCDKLDSVRILWSNLASPKISFSDMTVNEVTFYVNLELLNSVCDIGGTYKVKHEKVVFRKRENSRFYKYTSLLKLDR